jgi:hypothetical protein
VWKAVGARRWFEILGVAGYGAYLVIVALGNWHHDYYQLALMPVAPALAAVGVVELVSRYGAPSSRDTRLAVVLGLALLTTFVRHVSAHSWYDYAYEDVGLCRALSESGSVDDRLLFVGYSDPKFLFCADRKGWLLSDVRDPDDPRVTDALESGARVAILAADVNPAVREAIGGRAGPVLFAGTEFIAYRLQR